MSFCVVWSEVTIFAKRIAVLKVSAGLFGGHRSCAVSKMCIGSAAVGLESFTNRSSTEAADSYRRWHPASVFKRDARTEDYGNILVTDLVALTN